MTKAIQDSQSNVLRLTDILPGLLAVSWRLPSIVWTMKRLLNFQGDDRMSMGSALEHNAEVHADRTAILYENVKYTHREFNEAMNRYAHYFLSQGVQKGDEVVVLMENRPELLMMIGAMSKLGAISSLINPNQRGEVLKYSINLARGRHFIVGEELIDAFEEIKDGLKLTEKDALYCQPEAGQRPCPAGYVDLPDVLKGQSSNNPPTTGQVTLGDPFAYVFTSGTTGLPKASVQTHRRWFTSQYWFGKIVMNLKPKDIHYCPLPFYHTNALNVSWSAVAGGGAALAIRRKFSASNFLSDVRRFNANSFIYIGEICRYLMNQPQRPDDADNPLVACVGNGLRPDIWKAFKKRFGIKKVFELYGAAEGPLVFTNLLNVDCTVGTCRTPYAIIKYDVDANEPVRDENGFMQRVQKGEVGLLLAEINESLPFAGYKDKEETEKKIFRDVFTKGDSWFNFGDLVLNQGFKHILFVDRLGDTFRWKGENVSTGEVEKVLNTHNQVAQSTAYGVKIPGTDGRAGMAALVPATTVDVFDMKALGEIVVKGLPHYAVPRFIRFVKAFETTATHKIKKTALRNEAFDPAKVSEPLYVILPGTETYVPLTKELYLEIVGGQYRF
jgi:acyl-CoA synthetase (AMP-forming)/AMP-acid ligase II